MKRNGIAGILAAVLLSAWSLPAGAEETYKLDPVLVTAEKRTENVQDVPVSVTAISEQQIKDSGIRSIQDVARQVPNLFIANWGFRGNSYAFIRGIGAVNNDPAIGKEMANPKVQQAVRYAIDYEGLKKMCGEGASLPLSIVPQGFVGAKNRPDNYRNLDKAKALMKEAGYENGFTVELTAANFDTEGMKWPDIAQKIQADLKEIKIDVKIVTSEFSVMVDPYRKGELPFLVMHWSPDYFDINNQLAFLPGSTVGERAKWAADGHQDMIDLGNKIIGESDKTLRAQYSEQLQDLMAENSPYAFLLQHPKVYAYRTNLSNVSYCDLCKIQLKDLTVN